MTLHATCVVTDNAFGSSGWRAILQCMTTFPHVKLVEGLRNEFIRATTFDPAKVLRDLRCPVGMLQHRNPEETILEFCRGSNNGSHTGAYVATLTPGMVFRDTGRDAGAGAGPGAGAGAGAGSGAGSDSGSGSDADAESS